MSYLMELNEHYKAVRARLNGIHQPVKMAAPAPEPEPEPQPEPEPVVTDEERDEYERNMLLDGLRCMPETKEKIAPILIRENISWRTVCSDSRRDYLVKIRAEIYVVLNAVGFSLTQIGRMCGKRDHTTVLHSIRRFLDRNLSPREKEYCEANNIRPVVYYFEKTQAQKETQNDQS